MPPVAPLASQKNEIDPKNLKPGTVATRQLTFEMRQIDEEARTIELAFSSEEPYGRWFGTEILGHQPSEIRTGRLDQGAAVLVNHDPNQLVGVVESYSIDSDKTARAVVRLAKDNPHADAEWALVKDGVRRHVSVGYRVYEMKLLESSEEGGDTYRVIDWEPYEISLVSVPADPTVGIGRADDQPQPPVTTVNHETETKDMPPETQTPVATVPAAPVQPAIDENKVKQDASNDERNRVREIMAAGDKMKQPELARQFVDNGGSFEDFAKAVMEKMGAKPVDVTETPEIGMDESDLKRYSMTRAIQAIVEGDFKGRAGFEYECSLEAMKKTSAVPRAGNRGFLVPYDVLAKREVHAVNQRDLVVGTSTAGGHLVATNLLASSFIDLLRNKMVIMQAGATMLPDMVGNIAIPRQTGGATAYWLAENGAVTESQQAFDQVAMSPKTVGAYTDISRLLLKQSSIGLEDFVKGDLSTTLALAIDLAAIHGSGSSNQPTGIIATSGIGSVALGTNGAAPDRDTLIDLETEVAIDNADLGTLAYMTNTKVRGKLKKTATDSGSGLFVWDNTDTPTNGYRALVTNQVSSALTKGTSSGVCSAILFGNWADLILAFWGGLDIEVDPYSQSTTGAVRIVAFQSLDVAVRHPQSFAACLDALTA